ncbi:hypothetical protein [Pseudothauera lacus]|uniref:hypothetical protein n=1 Tax=Pseudothauera lacus TaxID=2136175 RepID=UPI002E253646
MQLIHYRQQCPDDASLPFLCEGQAAPSVCFPPDQIVSLSAITYGIEAGANSRSVDPHESTLPSIRECVVQPCYVALAVFGLISVAVVVRTIKKHANKQLSTAITISFCPLCEHAQIPLAI